MKSHFPDLTFFIDAAGRYSHSKGVPIVFAGLVVETSTVNEIRESLLATTKGQLLKWSRATGTKECSLAIFRLLGKRQVLGVVRVVWKNTPEWDHYFDEGQRLYEKGVKKAQEPIPFAKPMATFKLHQFGILCGDLIGLYARRHRNLLPKKHLPIRPIKVTAVFDSDIHGEANQRVCKDVFALIEGSLTQTQKHLRIRPKIEVDITTEQDEPLLLLADHLAGYHYSRGAWAKDEEGWQELLRAVELLVHKWPSSCCRIFEEPFRERYLISSATFDRVLPKKAREGFLKNF